MTIFRSTINICTCTFHCIRVTNKSQNVLSMIWYHYYCRFHYHHNYLFIFFVHLPTKHL